MSVPTEASQSHASDSLVPGECMGRMPTNATTWM